MTCSWTNLPSRIHSSGSYYNLLKTNLDANVSYLFSEHSSDAKSSIARPGQKGNSQNKRPVLRPIICICNDVNASSLAKLRPLALQMRMQRPPDIHIARRLREVCDLEGLKADSRALATLVGLAKGDLRGCLNTLQVSDSLSRNFKIV